MPCNSRVLQSIDFGLADVSLLKAAAAGIGADVVHCSYDERFSSARFVMRTNEGAPFVEYRIGADGKLYFPAGFEATAKRFKAAYSVEAVKLAAKRAGWRVSQSLNLPNRLTLKRG